MTSRSYPLASSEDGDTVGLKRLRESWYRGYLTIFGKQHMTLDYF